MPSGLGACCTSFEKGVEVGGLNPHLRGLLWGKPPVETAGISEDIRNLLRRSDGEDPRTRLTLAR